MKMKIEMLHALPRRKDIGKKRERTRQTHEGKVQVVDKLEERVDIGGRDQEAHQPLLPGMEGDVLTIQSTGEPPLYEIPPSYDPTGVPHS